MFSFGLIILELGLMKPIKHRKNLQKLEKKVNSHLEEFEKYYGKICEVSENEEDQEIFSFIYRSLKKCLKINPKKRPDFLELALTNIKKSSLTKEKIKFFILFKEKSIEELNQMDWNLEKKKETSEAIKILEENLNHLKINFNKKEEENKLLREEIKILRETVAKNTGTLREYNNEFYYFSLYLSFN